MKKLVMNKWIRITAAAGICLVLGLCGVSTSYACTAVYVGSGVSGDGTTIMAKSNDYQDVWANHVAITERVEDEPGRQMPVDNDRTVWAELPATTYRYTSTPWMDSAQAINGLGPDATVCTNEYGVGMMMSITSFSNAAALQADPLIEHGITEFTAVDLVTCQSASAREAVEVLAALIDEFGSSEVNIALISDREETWYVEMYNGHQYAAVRLPQDRVCVFGNEFLLEYLSDYEESITSPDLFRLAEENGFAVYGKDHEMNLLATYSGNEVVTDYSHMRTWIGHRLLSPSAYGEYDRNERYPLCFAPDEPVSLQDVMEIMRNRFEGTEYNPDETGRTDMRVIGTDTALSVHIVQTYPDYPADMACVTWESTGPAVYGVFVPISNAALSISEPYSRNQAAEDAYVFDTEHYPYYRFKELTTLCVEKDTYQIYGQPVRAYWHDAETGMIRGMSEVLAEAAASDDPGAAARNITSYCNQMQEQAFSDAGVLLNDVRWYMSRNSNTLKNGRNPETHEVLDELKMIDPMTVDLDGSAYREIPAGEDSPVLADCGVIEETEFGGVYIGITIDDFNALGFAYGDSLDIEFSNGYTMEDVPYYNGYYTADGEPLLVAYPGYPYIRAGMNNVSNFWEIAGMAEDMTATITLAEAGKYLKTQEARNLHYEDERSEYDSDEMFANFRNVTAGNIKEGVLYRSASPCDNQHNRAPYVDQLIREAGVQVIINLADTEEKILKYTEAPDFRSPYFLSLYEKGSVIPLAMNTNYRSGANQEKLAAGLTFMLEHPGPCLVHCTEGKDRTGFICILLEALCGAGYEEIRDDYMTTYANYYRITQESDPDKYAVIVADVLNPLIEKLITDPQTDLPADQADLAAMDLQKCAEEYLVSCGMKEEQILALRQRLETGTTETGTAETAPQKPLASPEKEE